MAEDDILDVVDELITVLASNDTELINLNECTKVQQMYNNLHDNIEMKFKDEIQAVSSSYEAEKHRIDHLKTDETESRVKEARERFEESLRDKQRAQAKFDECKAELEKCMAESEEIEEEKERSNNRSMVVIPNHRQEAKLLTYMTAVHWQYDCPPEEVRGYVTNKKQLKPFNLNTKENSKFFIANYLWDLVENDWE